MLSPRESLRRVFQRVPRGVPIKWGPHGVPHCDTPVIPQMWSSNAFPVVGPPRVVLQVVPLGVSPGMSTRGFSQVGSLSCRPRGAPRGVPQEGHTWMAPVLPQGDSRCGPTGGISQVGSPKWGRPLVFVRGGPPGGVPHWRSPRCRTPRGSTRRGHLGGFPQWRSPRVVLQRDPKGGFPMVFPKRVFAERSPLMLPKGCLPIGSPRGFSQGDLEGGSTNWVNQGILQWVAPVAFPITYSVAP